MTHFTRFSALDSTFWLFYLWLERLIPLFDLASDSFSGTTNYLGFNLRQYNGKLLLKPQKEKVLKFLQEIRDWLKRNQAVEQKIVIEQLSPKLRGFGNY